MVEAPFGGTVWPNSDEGTDDERSKTFRKRERVWKAREDRLAKGLEVK